MKLPVMDSFRGAPIELSKRVSQFDVKIHTVQEKIVPELTTGSYLLTLPSSNGQGKLLTQEQISRALALRYAGNRPIIDLSNTSVLHNFVGLCYNPSVGPDAAIEYFSIWSIHSGYMSAQLVSLTAKKESKTCRRCGRSLRDPFCSRCNRQIGGEISDPVASGGADSIPTIIMNKEAIFNMPTFDVDKRKDEMGRESIRMSEITIEGVEECPKCHARQVHKTIKQTRASDEAATVFYSCVACGNKWSI